MPTQPIDDAELSNILMVPYQHIEQTYTRKVHHFYLSSKIEEPILYIEMIHIIRYASPDDIIHLHLNLQGGQLSTGIQIISALQASEAHKICSLEGEAHSLGTLILLSADEFEIHDNGIMLFHNFSGGVFGKGNEQVAEIAATVDWFSTMAHQIYIPFLSKDEVTSVLKGEDLWLQSTEIKERLQTMVKHMEKEAKAKTTKKS